MTLDRMKIDLAARLFAVESEEVLARVAAILAPPREEDKTAEPEPAEEEGTPKVVSYPEGYVSPRPPAKPKKIPPGTPRRKFDLETLQRRRPAKSTDDNGELDRMIKALEWDEDETTESLLEMLKE